MPSRSHTQDKARSSWWIAPVLQMYVFSSPRVHARHDSIVQATYLDIMLRNIEGLQRGQFHNSPRGQREETYQVGHNNLGSSNLIGGTGRGGPAVGRSGCVRSDRDVGPLSGDSGRLLADSSSGSSGRASLSTATVLAGAGSEDLVERTIEVGRHGEDGT